MFRIGKLRKTYMVPEAGIEPACLAARDFKSLVSTDFTTRASGGAIAALESMDQAKADHVTWIGTIPL